MKSGDLVRSKVSGLKGIVVKIAKNMVFALIDCSENGNIYCRWILIENLEVIHEAR
jgi:hypothetical protein